MEIRLAILNVHGTGFIRGKERGEVDTLADNRVGHSLHFLFFALVVYLQGKCHERGEHGHSHLNDRVIAWHFHSAVLR